MATFRPGDAVPVRRTSSPARRAALVAGVALLGLLTACGTDKGTTSTPQKLPGAAQPASGDATADSSGTSAAPSGSATTSSSASKSSSATSSGTGNSASSTRCHTSELRVSLGVNNPGAGQEHFPVVLTNGSHRTCTLRGYPGAAFLDSSGKQLGPDPKRSADTPTTVTLAPGQTAWAGLTFANPEVSGAKTATPATLVVTPPDERDPLKVAWKEGAVPVSGNASSVSLTVVRAGNGV
ncbi:DUF4232 domain-containing protein [Streptomyces sp. NBC_00365]|uniref:DUF4232 domain-containing protein n=1 Tax=Streptomyces sp. NBC_00365 TaxID=2975726 RepID=UPI00224C937F|nr:DUF4232 domain-containing protein [Streptomyces sp. NBC_00365]MCX5088404.1 DUF4232 domain-containing protein [Streptomyces sp. NBC_00365]